MRSGASIWVLIAAAGCVPSGNATPQDAGPAPKTPSETPATRATSAPPADLLRTVFDDEFERTGPPSAPAAASPGEASPPVAGGVNPGPEWVATMAGIWRIEGGRLCGEHAHNHGIWLRRTLPVNARIEFDAVSQSTDGDLKAEYWGDGRSFATALSYTNATSYLTIFGGWHNKSHVLARLNEHGSDRKEITVDPSSDDPREKPVGTAKSTGSRSNVQTARRSSGGLMATRCSPGPTARPSRASVTTTSDLMTGT